MSFVNDAIDFLKQEYQDAYEFLFVSDTSGKIILTVKVSSMHHHNITEDTMKYIHWLYMSKEVGTYHPFKWQDDLVDYIEDALYT